MRTVTGVEARGTFAASGWRQRLVASVRAFLGRPVLIDADAVRVEFQSLGCSEILSADDLIFALRILSLLQPWDMEGKGPAGEVALFEEAASLSEDGWAAADKAAKQSGVSAWEAGLAMKGP